MEDREVTPQSVEEHNTVEAEKGARGRELPASIILSSQERVVDILELIRNAACRLLPCGAPMAALEAGAVAVQSIAVYNPDALRYIQGQEYYSDILKALEVRFLQYINMPISINGEGEGLELDLARCISLAKDGASCKQIIKSIFGADILTGYVQGVEDGRVLAFGDRGEDVRRIQNQLNVISVMHPEIEKLLPDGIYGVHTERAVRTFQKRRFLKDDAVAGRVTRTEIFLSYNKARRLIESAQQRYNGIESVPVPADKGRDVLEVQKLLGRLGFFYPHLNYYALKMQSELGQYGQETARCVSAAQDILNTARSGACNTSEICKLSGIYMSLQGIMPPPLFDGIAAFDSRELYEGCIGDTVYLASKYISEISQVFDGISQIEISDVFTPELHRAVVQFQTLFCQGRTDGRIDGATWERITQMCRDARAYKQGVW